METLRKVLKQVLQPFSSCEEVVFSTDICKGEKHILFTILGSYFFNFREGKYVSGLMRWKSVKMPCISCISSMQYIEELI